jgi:hypothetical protein
VDEIARARARLSSLEEALKAAATDRDMTAAVSTKARTALDAAAGRLAGLERQVDEARDDERAARRALTDATRVASEAELMHARTARDVAKARELLTELEQT